MNEQKETGIIKAGMAIVISHGEYSDYTFGQVYIAVQDFNYMEEAKKFAFEQYEKRLEERKDEVYLFVKDYEFEDYLIRKGLLALCNYREIHTGAYYFFDEEEWEEEFLTEKGIK